LEFATVTNKESAQEKSKNGSDEPRTVTEDIFKKMKALAHEEEDLLVESNTLLPRCDNITAPALRK
jgi:hypothetical protein